MIRIGIVGFGFMGKMHFRCYKNIKGVQIAAICDADANKLKEDSKVVGNIKGTEEPLDLTDIVLYTDYDKMLAEANLDAVSITLPTFMHKDFTVKALRAGINVLCEKPMALNENDCLDMIIEAQQNKKILQIGHCMRFWPEYAKTKEIIDSGKYGKVKAAIFRRLSLTPSWSWDNWLTGQLDKSGGAILDLHIHDTDFVQYLFGMPKSVTSKGVKIITNDIDHIVTSYTFDDDTVVTAEGGWAMMPGFGFEMSFNIIMEKATIIFDCTRDPSFKLHPAQGDTFTPEVASGDGYSLEIEHFIKTIEGQDVTQITTPAESLDSVRIILAEKQSAMTGKEVILR